MVEGGRIDHAHHAVEAKRQRMRTNEKRDLTIVARALSETVALDEAVEAAMAMLGVSNSDKKVW